MLISISGLIGSGKDTVADYLVAQHGFKRESFAGALKDAVSVVFNWDRELLEGRSSEARLWREQVDAWWAKRLNIPTLTPRWVLQYWGTEVLRHGFHDDIWIASLENRLLKTNQDIVISDCRFPNEISTIQSLKGTTVRVQRGTDPDWFKYAYDCANEQNKKELAKLQIHPSEYMWVASNFDITLSNNGTITELYTSIEQVLTSKIRS